MASSRIVDSHTSVKIDWKINKFSYMECKHKSDIFYVGNLKWRVNIYPKGAKGTHDHLSIYLVPVDQDKEPYAGFCFVVKSQTDSRKNEIGPVSKHKFLSGKGNGWPEFMTTADLYDRPNGYLKYNTCIIQVKVKCRAKAARE